MVGGPDRESPSAPPVGWADVATKRDLDHLAVGLRAEMNALRFELRSELQRGLRVQLLAFLTANAAMLGILVAALEV